MKSVPMREGSRRTGGPKTVKGKARSSQNAVRHALSVAPKPGSAADDRIDELASALLKAVADRSIAREIAEAQVALELALNRKGAVFQTLLTTGITPDSILLLERLDRYERRARSKRSKATVSANRLAMKTMMASRLPPGPRDR